MHELKSKAHLEACLHLAHRLWTLPTENKPSSLAMLLKLVTQPSSTAVKPPGALLTFQRGRCRDTTVAAGTGTRERKGALLGAGRAGGRAKEEDDWKRKESATVPNSNMLSVASSDEGAGAQR